MSQGCCHRCGEDSTDCRRLTPDEEKPDRHEKDGSGHPRKCYQPQHREEQLKLFTLPARPSTYGYLPTEALLTIMLCVSVVGRNVAVKFRGCRQRTLISFMNTSPLCRCRCGYEKAFEQELAGGSSNSSSTSSVIHQAHAVEPQPITHGSVARRQRRGRGRDLAPYL